MTTKVASSPSFFSLAFNMVIYSGLLAQTLCVQARSPYVFVYLIISGYPLFRSESQEISFFYEGLEMLL